MSELAWAIAVGVVLAVAILCLAGALIVFARYGVLRIAQAGQERAERAAERAAQAALAAEQREQDRQALGPWWKLVEAIEAAPMGRVQIDLDLILAADVPDNADVERYLWRRWPGLELAREDLPVSNGIVIHWRGRP